MPQRRRIVLGMIIAFMALCGLQGTNAAISTPLALGESNGAIQMNLTETPPLPEVPSGATAVLRRITLAPGATLDVTYHGPVLYYVEQGTLGVDMKNRRLAIVQSCGANDCGTRINERRGEIQTGLGVYAADGDLGPTRNVGDQDLIVTALLIVPQPSGSAIDQGGGNATAVP
jgi:hypothetical protein